MQIVHGAGKAGNKVTVEHNRFSVNCRNEVVASMVAFLRGVVRVSKLVIHYFQTEEVTVVRYITSIDPLVKNSRFPFSFSVLTKMTTMIVIVWIIVMVMMTMIVIM